MEGTQRSFCTATYNVDLKDSTYRLLHKAEAAVSCYPQVHRLPGRPHRANVPGGRKRCQPGQVVSGGRPKTGVQLAADMETRLWRTTWFKWVPQLAPAGESVVKSESVMSASHDMR